MRNRIARHRILQIVWGLAAAAGPVSAQSQVLPRPEGPSSVGYWRTELATDRSAGRGHAVQTGARNLLVEVWFPVAGQRPAAAAKRYTSRPVEDALAAQLGLSAGWAGRVVTHAVEGATPAAGRRPVVIFSHGLSWPISLYQSYAEDLASRGYVVIGVNHPGGALIDFGGGRTLPQAEEPSFSSDSTRNAFLARLTAAWADDLRAVLGQLPDWDAERSSPLFGHLDLGRIGLIGHSLGGSAAAHLSADPRVKAVVALEGKFRDTSAANLVVRAPFLHMIGEYNRLELENREYRPSTGAPVYQVVIAGTGHAYFSDLMVIYKASAQPAWLARHRYELEPGRIIQITRDYITAFLDRFLLDIDHALLHPTGYSARVDGPRAAGYAEVRLTIDMP